MKLISKSPNDTIKAGEELANKLKNGGFVALYGNLGAGKTAFVSGLAKGLSCNEPVTSPTYTIMQEYKGEIPLYHFDMYRINNFDALYGTGFFDYLDTECVIAVEWSENIAFALPESLIKVTIEYGKSENERIITIELQGDYQTKD